MNTKQWNILLEKLAKQLHSKSFKGVIDPDMVKMHSIEIYSAIEKGYGSKIDDKELDAVKYETLYNLQTNCFHFSGAKNWNQIREMSALLTDKNNSTLPFNKYLEAVKAIDVTYNTNYLKAEYETAITSGQMISKWKQFEAEANILPNLRWVTGAGESVCPICSKLDGITLPFKDSFWKTTFVPRHFRCGCNIVQEDEFAEITDISKREIPDTHPMFKNNVGISGVAFTEKHPYFKTMPDDVKKQVFLASEELMDKKK